MTSQCPRKFTSARNSFEGIHKPSGANISINDNDTGKQSPAILPEKAGTYHVRVQLDGYEPVEREVKVEPGRPAMVNITLKPASSGKR